MQGRAADGASERLPSVVIRAETIVMRRYISCLMFAQIVLFALSGAGGQSDERKLEFSLKSLDAGATQLDVPGIEGVTMWRALVCSAVGVGAVSAK